MNIVWFEKTPKGRGNAAIDKAYKITFTDKPKGVRCNVALTRKLAELGTDYVLMGIEQESFVVKPVLGRGQGFKLITNKSSAQVCAASIGEWAVKNSLIKKRVKGHWDEKNSCFAFDLTSAIPEGAADEPLVTTF
ncbi:MAG: hypothetical protein KGZ50_00125 [Peptococcaceae bacterium]|nr:hypothetical protein [Peptococcaceae bacterium]MBT9151891.1 hypothetical protein [Bacillota bacterium]MBT9157641.1 hypothetical protein [Bacillota bacterium]